MYFWTICEPRGTTNPRDCFTLKSWLLVKMKNRNTTCRIKRLKLHNTNKVNVILNFFRIQHGGISIHYAIARPPGNRNRTVHPLVCTLSFFLLSVFTFFFYITLIFLPKYIFINKYADIFILSHTIIPYKWKLPKIKDWKVLLSPSNSGLTVFSLS